MLYFLQLHKKLKYFSHINRKQRELYKRGYSRWGNKYRRPQSKYTLFPNIFRLFLSSDAGLNHKMKILLNFFYTKNIFFKNVLSAILFFIYPFSFYYYLKIKLTRLQKNEENKIPFFICSSIIVPVAENDNLLFMLSAVSILSVGVWFLYRYSKKKEHDNDSSDDISHLTSDTSTTFMSTHASTPDTSASTHTSTSDTLASDGVSTEFSNLLEKLKALPELDFSTEKNFLIIQNIRPFNLINYSFVDFSHNLIDFIFDSLLLLTINLDENLDEEKILDENANDEAAFDKGENLDKIFDEEKNLFFFKDFENILEETIKILNEIDYYDLFLEHSALLNFSVQNFLKKLLHSPDSLAKLLGDLSIILNDIAHNNHVALEKLSLVLRCRFNAYHHDFFMRVIYNVETLTDFFYCFIDKNEERYTLLTSFLKSLYKNLYDYAVLQRHLRSMSENLFSLFNISTSPNTTDCEQLLEIYFPILAAALKQGNGLMYASISNSLHRSFYEDLITKLLNNEAYIDTFLNRSNVFMTPLYQNPAFANTLPSNTLNPPTETLNFFQQFIPNILPYAPFSIFAIILTVFFFKRRPN